MKKILLTLMLLPALSFAQVSYTVTITHLKANADNCDGGAPFCLNAPQDPVFNIWTNDASANEFTSCWIFEDDAEIEYGLWKDIQNLEIASVANVATSYINFDMSGFESDNLNPGCSSSLGDDAIYDRQFVQQFLLADIPEGTDFLATIDLQQVYFAKVVIHWIDLTAGTEEFVNDLAFSVVPNPSNGVFNVKLGLDNYSEVNLTVTDMSGRIVYSNDLYQIGQDIDLSDFETGAYYVTIAHGDKIARERITIK